MRCTVAYDGAVVQTELLYAISHSQLEAMYDAPPVVYSVSTPPLPTENGVYLLINNVWVREED